MSNLFQTHVLSYVIWSQSQCFDNNKGLSKMQNGHHQQQPVPISGNVRLSPQGYPYLPVNSLIEDARLSYIQFLNF